MGGYKWTSPPLSTVSVQPRPWPLHQPSHLELPLLTSTPASLLPPVNLLLPSPHPSISQLSSSGAMHPQRPLPQAMPSSFGQNLRDMAMGLGRGKNFLGGNIAYGFIQSFKECLYFLLCCWCIKEILDWEKGEKREGRSPSRFDSAGLLGLFFSQRAWRVSPLVWDWRRGTDGRCRKTPLRTLNLDFPSPHHASSAAHLSSGHQRRKSALTAVLCLPSYAQLCSLCTEDGCLPNVYLLNKEQSFWDQQYLSRVSGSFSAVPTCVNDKQAWLWCTALLTG